VDIASAKGETEVSLLSVWVVVIVRVFIYFGMGRVFDFVRRIEGGKKREGEGAVTSYNSSGKAEFNLLS
jgi:hypothetical protein